MTHAGHTRTSGCFCAAVRHRVVGTLRGSVIRHGTQCRKANAKIGARARAARGNPEISADQGLVWYQATGRACGGFCGRCGSPFFWEAGGQSGTGITAGALGDCAKLTTIGHIRVREKPDYDQINARLPQFAVSSREVLPGDGR